MLRAGFAGIDQSAGIARTEAVVFSTRRRSGACAGSGSNYNKPNAQRKVLGYFSQRRLHTTRVQAAQTSGHRWAARSTRHRLAVILDDLYVLFRATSTSARGGRRGCVAVGLCTFPSEGRKFWRHRFRAAFHQAASGSPPSLSHPRSGNISPQKFPRPSESRVGLALSMAMAGRPSLPDWIENTATARV